MEMEKKDKYGEKNSKKGSANRERGIQKIN